MKHKHADVIHAWADGKAIQYSSIRLDDWQDYNLIDLDSNWINNPEIKWRIKPKTLRYRVALMKGGAGNYWAKLVHTEDEVMIDVAYNTYYTNYVKWLTDWVEVEV